MNLPLLYVALELEREASRLYTGLSERAQDVGEQRTFLFLVRQERGHIARLEKEIDKRPVERAQPPPDALARAAQHRARLLTALQDVRQRPQEAADEAANQLRSLEIAGAMEEFLCGFYQEAVSETEGQPSNEFFLKMLQTERAHLELLQGYMTRLKATGHFPTDGMWQTLFSL